MEFLASSGPMCAIAYNLFRARSNTKKVTVKSSLKLTLGENFLFALVKMLYLVLIKVLLWFLLVLQYWQVR